MFRSCLTARSEWQEVRCRLLGRIHSFLLTLTLLVCDLDARWQISRYLRSHFAQQAVEFIQTRARANLFFSATLTRNYPNWSVSNIDAWISRVGSNFRLLALQ